MDEATSKTFSVPDIAVFAAMLFVSLSIGLCFAFRNRHRNGTLSYFLGNRELKALPVAMSFVVTFQSSILILGFPAEAYAYGMQYGIQVVGVIISYWLAAVLVVPIYYPLKVTSAYQYYQLRYGENSVRFVAVACGAVYYLLYMGMVLYGTALALLSVADVPMWLTVVVFTTVTVLYTSLGGMQAVIWTDVFQCFVMVFGILAVLVSSTYWAGGPARVLELSRSRFNFFNFDPDPTRRHTFWTLMIGSSSQFFYLTISQAGIQRINSTPSITAAKGMMLICGPAYAFTWILSMFEGVTLFAYFSNKGCDPLAAGELANMNQLIPYSMIELFHGLPGLSGLVISALAAAALSTISSGLSSLAAITYEDIVKTIKPNIRDTTATCVSKIAVAVFGVIAAAISFLLMNSRGPMGQLFVSLCSTLDGPMVGLYLTSIFFKRARPKAMVVAVLLGAGFVLWLGSGQNFTNTSPTPAFLPHGPTTNCSISTNVTNVSTNVTNVSMYSVATTESNPLGPDYDTTTLRSMVDGLGQNYSKAPALLNSSDPVGTPYMTTTEVQEQSTERSALQTFYSISYMYFNLIGALIVASSGIIISLCTQPISAPEVDKRLVISLSDLLPCTARRKKYDVRKGRLEDAFNEEELQYIKDLDY